MNRGDRHAGVLLHPTSLPGPYGIGEIGGEGPKRVLDWLEAAAQSIWQTLPIGPVDGGGSPYSSPSASARSPLLLSIDELVADGWLLESERPAPFGHPDKVDYAQAIEVRTPVLLKAADRLRQQVGLEAFASAHGWVHPWALYAALTEENGPEWTKWPEPLRDRDETALASAEDRLADAIGRHTALQWLFLHQWTNLRDAAKARGIALWGDVPFFVGGESADAWWHRELFRLDAAGRPTAISGVPPDMFSEKGQRWGHPLYDEDAHRAEGYRWWTERVAGMVELFDRVRIDHFRGFESYWEIPAGDEDATRGHWIPGPGQPLLDALKAHFGALPFVAEDLGVITPEVEKLRDDNDLPGMAILEFAFGDPDGGDNPYLPHHHRHRQVVFPGTHDNDTAAGWYASADEKTKDHVRRYFSTDGRDIAGDLVKAAHRSVARWAIVQMQDLLSLPTEARMNVPGKAEGNWAWRLRVDQLDLGLAARVEELTRLTGRRVPRPPAAPVAPALPGDQPGVDSPPEGGA